MGLVEQVEFWKEEVFIVHWKKRFGFMVLVCLILMMSVGSPIAASGEASAADDGTVSAASIDLAGGAISPMFLYINRVTTSLSISSSGYASATGSLIGYPGITTKVWIFLYLQKYSNGSWVTVEDWSGTFISYHGALSGSAYVPSGYNYRVKGSYYAWTDDDYEQIYGYSNNLFH